MAGQITLINERIFIGDAEHCRRDEPELNTLHIQCPDRLLCQHGEMIGSQEHGNLMIYAAVGHAVLTWHEFVQPLSIEMLDETYTWYEEQAPDAVFVHCAAGLHRSATICLAFLCREGMDILEAIPILIGAMWNYPTAQAPALYANELKMVREWAKLNE